VKPGPGGTDAGSIKIEDILTGPRSSFRGTRVKADARRARPSPSVGIHAHPVDEAFSLEEGLSLVRLVGKLSSNRPYVAEVFLRHPYTFSIMKLFAFRDRLKDFDKEFGRYHALDLYTIIATSGEEEWEYVLKLRDQQGHQPYALEAGRLVSEHFSTLDGLGMVRLRESPYYRSELQLNEFMSVLIELFPATIKTNPK
jgi:hypothetical protein